MKVKSKTIIAVSVIIVGILFVYLIHLNIKVNNHKSIENQTLKISDELVEVSKVNNDETIPKETEIEKENTIVEEPIEEDPIVYDGKTMNELADQLNKSLNSAMSGKGYLIASYSLEKGVDPYLATAIILQETGCKWTCSSLVYECNNVGGQVGYGCGRYSYFSTLDEGIIAFIDNLYNNYVSYGLTTAEAMNSKYAESTLWAEYVNNYIESIKAQ